jgi:hypothetical protein
MFCNVLENMVLRASHVVPRDLIDAQRPHLAHDGGELAVHDLQHAVYASLAEGCEAPDVRPADADRAGAQAERLQNVGPAAHAAIDQHRDVAAHRLDDLGEHADRRLPAFLRAPSVIGDEDGVHAMAQRLPGVRAGHDALEHQLALDDRAQAIDEFPGHAGAVEVGHLGDVDTVEVGLAAHLVGEGARLVAQRAVALVQASRAEHVLRVAPTLPVDGQDDRGRSGGLSVPDQRARRGHPHVIAHKFVRKSQPDGSINHAHTSVSGRRTLHRKCSYAV